jgi:hypothetical protein
MEGGHVASKSAPAWLHSAVPPDRMRPLQERPGVGPRDQARRLPHDRQADGDGEPVEMKIDLEKAAN